ncbi:MAG: AlpA family phage regulatory protein [Sulfuricurvum sp.]|jgi:predicted DNA-binding transcriptional regulator AlpA
MNDLTTKDRQLRLPDVMKKVGIKRSTIYGHMKFGKFPKCKKVSGIADDGKTAAVCWLESEIDEYVRGEWNANEE